VDVNEKITFWYGCNVLRHGDIIHACLDILRAVGYEPSPVGGPDYCCGTVKDANQGAAAGMATRTVGKLNDRGARVVAWCPSCHSHMHDFMEHGNERRFDMSYLVEVLHARRDRLAPLLVNRVPMRVMLHQHMGFNDLVPVNRMVPELLSLIPGVQVVDGGYVTPGYMCASFAPMPAAMQDIQTNTVRAAKAAGASSRDHLPPVPAGAGWPGRHRRGGGLQLHPAHRAIDGIALRGRIQGLEAFTGCRQGHDRRRAHRQGRRGVLRARDVARAQEAAGPQIGTVPIF
jgi:hypothetical protein